MIGTNSKFNHMQESIYLDETLFRGNDCVRINRPKVFMLLNTFPVAKMDRELSELAWGKDKLKVSDWLLNRMKVLARFEYERFEDKSTTDMNGYTIAKPLNSTMIEMDHERNLKIYTLQFVMGILSAVYTTTYNGTKDKRKQDELFIKLFYEIVDRLDYKELLDIVIEEVYRHEENIEKVYYDEVIEYSLIKFFTTTNQFNPYNTNLYETMKNYITPALYKTNTYKSLYYSTYNKKYKSYNDIQKFKHILDMKLSGYESRSGFDNAIDNFCKEEYEDFMLQDMVRILVEEGVDYSDQEYIDELFNKFGDKYKYVGKVYHGCRDLSGRNKDVKYLLNRYKGGSVSSSKDVSVAMEFATHGVYYPDNEMTTVHGFVAEIDLTEDMKSIDIEKILLDMIEKYPEITDWAKGFLHEREVLIPAEYVHDAKILSYNEAEEIKESDE